MSEAMLKVKVIRSKWMRGEVGSALLLSDGRMCCLGFACETAGVPHDVMLNQNSPLSLLLSGMVDKLPESLRLLVARLTKATDPDNYNNNTEVCGCLMNINDRYCNSAKDREANIIREGLKAGIEFTFED